MASKITFFTEIEINQPGLGVQLMYWSIVNGWCCPIGVLFFCGSLKNRVVPTWKWFIYLRIRKTNLVCFSIFRLIHPFVVIVDLWPTIPKNKQVDIVFCLPWHSCTRVWVITQWRGSPPVAKAVFTQRGSSHPWQKSCIAVSHLGRIGIGECRS